MIDRFRSILAAGHRIARALAVERVLEALRESTLALLTVERCSIAVPGEGGARVVYGDADPIDPDMVAEALASGRVAARPSAPRSALCAPIFAHGRVSALLFAARSDANGFDDESTQIAEFLTMLAGAALENAEERTTELARVRAELDAGAQHLEDTRQQLLHAGRLAAVGTLIAGLTHELSNPLTVIVGNAESLLRMLPAEDEQQRHMVEAIERQGQRAAKLTAALLRFSRTRPEKRDAIDPGDLVRTVADLVSAEARRRAVELAVSLPDGLPAIAMSREDIESALVNIATNALQATPPRGRVEIEAAAEQRGGRPGVTFSIRDTGTGISAGLLSQIFDPFFTTKPAGQGTGLGLSLAREAVGAHGGRLEVDSMPGAGTTMRVWLPLQAADAPDTPP